MRIASDQVEKAAALLRGLSLGDQDLTVRHVSADGFVQHDPDVADGVDGLRQQASRSAGRLEIARVLEDGPLVVVHGRHDAGGEERVFFAVFRFKNGLLVEFWRFSTPLAPPNRSGHTQTDGPTKPDLGQDTAGSKVVVRDYYETVHIGGRHDRIGDYMQPIVRDLTRPLRHRLYAFAIARPDQPSNIGRAHAALCLVTQASQNGSSHASISARQSPSITSLCHSRPPMNQ